MNSAPKNVKLKWCPACGRNDRFAPLRDNHYSGGKRCDGDIVSLTYELQPKARVATDGPRRDIFQARHDFPHDYIIEHPALGVLRDFEGDPDGRQAGARFSWSAMRNDMEKTMHFSYLREVGKALRRIPERMRNECEVRVWDERAIEWKLVHR